MSFLIAIVVLELLLLRDRERLGRTNLGLAMAAWPAFATLGYVRFRIAGDSTEYFWPTAAGLYLAVLLVTGGRPALLFAGVFEDDDWLSSSERRRGRFAQVCVALAAVAAGLLPELL